MEELVIEPQNETPGIIFKPNSNEFKIFGKSLPEDARVFYDPVLKYLVNYKKNPKPQSHLEVTFEYYNSSSVRKIMALFKIFEQIWAEGHEASITWLYEEGDDVMKESGKDFKELVSLPFEVKSYHEKV